MQILRGRRQQESLGGGAAVRLLITISMIVSSMPGDVPSIPPVRKNSLSNPSSASKTPVASAPTLSPEALNLYQRTVSKSNGPIKIGTNIAETAQLFAVELIRAIQQKRKELDEQGLQEQDVIIHFATGKTPILGYVEAAEIIQGWHTAEKQEILKRCGMTDEELQSPPEMSRVRALALDAIFPQLSTAYRSYAFILKKIFDKFGIPEEKRHYFYGDFYGDFHGDMPHEWDKVEAAFQSDRGKKALADFTKVVEDVRKNGVKVRQFLAGKLLTTDPQYDFLGAMQQQANDLADALRGKGVGKDWFVPGAGVGAHIIINGVGPSYEGDGHSAFNEAYSKFLESVSYDGKKPLTAATDYWNQTAWTGQAHPHVVIEQAKARGGLRNLYVYNDQGEIVTDEEGRPRVQIGVITFGLGDLRLREDAKVIIIATDLPKSSSVQVFLEEEVTDTYDSVATAKEKEYPLFAFRDRNTTLILDDGAASQTELMQAPWEFQEVEWGDRGEFSKETAEHLFYWLAQKTGKPMSELTVDDWLKLPVGGDENSQTEIRRIRESNLKNFRTKYHSWKEAQSRVVSGILERANAPGAFARKMAQSFAPSSKGEKPCILLINPHEDDEYLAYQWIIPELVKLGVEIIPVYLTPGYTAVSNNYLFDLFSEMVTWSDQEISRIRQWRKRGRQSLLKEIAALLEKEYPQRNRILLHPSPMSKRELHLRAAALFMYIDEYFSKKQDYKIENAGQLRTIIEIAKSSASPTVEEEWSPISNTLIDEFKTGVRVFEAELAMVSLGIPFKNIKTIFAQWYGHKVHAEGVSEEDVKSIYKLLKKYHPHAIIVNGERFGDAGAHHRTEMSTLAALWDYLLNHFFKKKRIHQGNLAQSIFRYAGVWWRIPCWEAENILVLSKEEMQDMARRFEAIYHSQADGLNRAAPVPDAALTIPTSFGDQVILNAAQGRQELINLLGEEAVFERFPQLRDGGGVLAMRTIYNKEELDARRQELRRINPTLKPDQEIFGEVKVKKRYLSRLTQLIQAMRKAGIAETVIGLVTGNQPPSSTPLDQQI